MKSIRLNKDIRAEIVFNIMQSYSEENTRPVPPKDGQDDLSSAVLDWFFETNKSTIKRLEKLNKEFPALLRSSSGLNYKNQLGETKYIYFTTKTDNPRDSNGYWIANDTVPDFLSGMCIDLSNADTDIPPAIQEVIDGINGAKKRVRAQRALVIAYDKEKANYEQDVTQVLDGCNTSGQLILVWEEVEKFLPKGVANPSIINLPSVNIAALSRKLGKQP